MGCTWHLGSGIPHSAFRGPYSAFCILHSIGAAHRNGSGASDPPWPGLWDGVLEQGKGSTRAMGRIVEPIFKRT
jgi:hypothetical protein